MNRTILHVLRASQHADADAGGGGGGGRGALEAGADGAIVAVEASVQEEEEEVEVQEVLSRRLVTRRENVANARAARWPSRAISVSSTTTREDIKLTALMVPGAASLLGVCQKEVRAMSHHPPMEAMVKLAMSAKVKGSGSEIDRVRKLQHQACAFHR